MADEHQYQDWQQAGEFMDRLQQWFDVVFREVLAAVGATPPGDTPIPLAILPGGLLHMASKERDKIRLHAFLQLGSALGGGPWVAWEFVASATDRTRKLPISPWEQMPRCSTEGWRTWVDQENLRVDLTPRDIELRYAAIYHRLQAWDGRRTALLEAWKDTSHAMRRGKFMRDSVVKAFLKGVEKE